MNYIEVGRKYWELFRGEAPEFVRRRVDVLVRSGYLAFAGTTGLRTTYQVIGSTPEYDRAAEIMITEMS